ncbi:MAG TPA: DinB family protein [Candidatus Acidoferrum sp.]|nr:DinB family protein [Candidatus Acidoferrum sp.]
MFKSLMLAATMFLVAVPATETLTQAEREKGIAELEGSKKMFLDATKGLSEAQWNFKAAPDRWSIAECAEHIALAEGFIFGRITDGVMKTPLTPEKRSATAGKDEKIVAMLQDRTHKATAPEPIDPTKKTMTHEESLKLFLESRAKSEDFIKSTQEDLRDHIYDHPVPAIGSMDAYQWVLFMSGHTRRHTLQILEVKADPNFPKM